MTNSNQITASIGGITHLSGEVFKRLVKFTKDAKDAPEKVRELATKTRNLAGILTNLELLASSLDDAESSSSLKAQHLNSCRQTLLQIDKKLEKAQDDFESGDKIKIISRRLKWPYTISDTKSLYSELSDHCDILQLALAADNMDALLRCLAKQDDLNKRFEEKLETEIRVQMNQKRFKVVDFLLRINPQGNLDMSRQLRHAMTGMWLTESDNTFLSWKETPNAKLWLSGIPGGGKTVLCGAVIDTVLQEGDELTAIAYAFCDYKDPKTHQPENIAAALAIQIAQQKMEAFNLLEEYYEELRATSQLPREPKLEELLTLIDKMSSMFTKVFVVVDGLDECRENVASMTKSLKSLADRSEAISAAFFSRNEVDIQEQLEDDYDHIEIEAHTEDLKAYVLFEASQRRSLKKVKLSNSDLYEDIIRTLVDGARGMFRWVACQIDHISELPTNSARRKALRTLPPTLFQTYDRVLDRVRELPPTTQAFIRKTLHWVALRGLQIKIPALCEAISIEPECNEIDPDDFIDEDEISRLCGCLLRKSWDGEYFEFPHFTVMEYLQSENSQSAVGEFAYSSTEAWRSLTETSFRFLMFPCFDRKLTAASSLEEAHRVQRNTAHPFYPVAAELLHRLKDLVDDDEYLTILNDDSVSPHLRQLFHVNKSDSFMSWALEWMMLHNACQYQGGLSTWLAVVLSSTLTPLNIAAHFHLSNICSYLLEKGADVNSVSPIGTPLISALQRSWDRVHAGKAVTSTLKALMDYGADTSARIGERKLDCSEDAEESALGIALNCWGSNPAILPLIRSTSRVDEDAIAFVSEYGDYIDEDVLRAILEISTGANAPVQWQPMLSPVTLLLAKRNNSLPPDQPTTSLNDTDFWGALRLATEKGLVTELSKLLADDRCDADRQSGRDLLRIAAECEFNSDHTMRLLLDRLNPAVSESELQKSLYTSCKFDNASIISLLLARGASISAKDEEGKTAWHIAAENGSRRILKILSETDSNTAHSLSTTSGSGSTPLVLSLMSGHADTSILLLGLCSSDLIFFQPSDMILHLAAKSNSIDLFKALLAKGLDLKSVGPDGSTPLHHVKPNGITVDFARYLASIYDVSHLDHSSRSAFESLLSGWLAIENLLDRPDLKQDLWGLFIPPGHTFRSERSIPHRLHVWDVICKIIQNNTICPCVKMIYAKFQCNHYLMRAINEFIKIGALSSYEKLENRAAIIPVISALRSRTWDWSICESVGSILSRVIESSTLQANLRDTDESYDLLARAIRQSQTHATTQLLRCGLDVHRQIFSKDNRMQPSMSAIEIACVESTAATLELVVAAADPCRLKDTLKSGMNLIDLVVEGYGWEKPLKIQSLHNLGVKFGMTSKSHEGILFAANKSEWGVVRCLLSLGADPFIQDETDWAPIHYIVRGDSVETLECIREMNPTAPKWHLTCFSDSVRDPNIREEGVGLLSLAARNGHDEMVEYLLTQELVKDINIVSSSGETPLHGAAWCGSLATVELLIRNGANVGIRTAKNSLPIDYALEKGQLEIAKYLIKSGSPRSSKWSDEALENFKDDPDMTDLSEDFDEGTNYLREISFEKAVLGGHVDTCKRTIDQGRSVHKELQSCHNCTPLLAAICVGKDELVEWLLDQGALPTSVYCYHNPYTDICQHATDRLMSANCLRRVISSAVDNRTCRYPAAPSLLHIAVSRGRSDFLPVLLEHFNDNPDHHMNIWKLQQASDDSDMSTQAMRSMFIDRPGQIGDYWETALHCASRNGNIDAVELLIEHGANVNVVDVDEYTPLMRAIVSNHIDIVEELLCNGASIEQRNSNGLSAAAVAVRENRLDIIKLLAEHSPACLNFASQYGQNLLSNLSQTAASLEVFQYLMSRGLDPFFEDQLGVCAIWVWLDNANSNASFFDYLIHSNVIQRMPPGKGFNPLSFLIFNVKRLKIFYKCLPVKTALVFRDLQTRIQQSPLCRAASRGLLPILAVLLKLGANIEKEGSVFGTPLMCAAAYGRLDSVKFLARSGASLQYISDEGVSRNAILASLAFPEITNWFLIGRYLDQKKVTNSSFTPNQPIKLWGGSRQMKVALEVWQRYRWEESTIDYCKRIHRVRKHLGGKIVTGELL